jgi:predicted DNA-binding protein
VGTKRKHSHEGGIVTSIRLTAEQHEALKDLALRENRSVTGQVRHLIERALDESKEAV